MTEGSATVNEQTAHLEESEGDKLFEQRLLKAQALRELGIDPYANDFLIDTTLATVHELYAAKSSEDLASIATEHTLAGRIMAINAFGKAAFLRLQDTSGKLQIYLRKNDLTEQEFLVFKKLDIGDFIGVVGVPMRTKTGELSLHVHRLRLLTKALRPLPEKWHGLAAVEKRYRHRYLDLIVNEHVREIFKKRAAIINYIRDFFKQRDFLEVETPMMHPLAGGAAAKPFITHHNSLKTDLYLRIAPELYLKRLVVGGFERVFEINRNFRNEGLSTFHNPEFTMLEFYQAYITYKELMNIAEELLSGVTQHVLQTLTIEREGQQISLAPPFARLTMVEAISKYGDLAPETLLNPQETLFVAENLGLKTKAPDGQLLKPGEVLLLLFEHLVEPKLLNPTFIYDFPAEVSPLSRRKSTDPRFVERFELFIGGREFANAFSELNDPLEQRERFLEQLAAKNAGNEEAHELDEDYLYALEHGMPPTGGLGLGIDRLVMLLTQSASIREVILFPQLRKEL